jgi:hypothetical protein
MTDDSRRINTAISVVNIPKVPREETPPKQWPVWALKMREKYEHDIHELRVQLSEMENAIVANSKANQQLAIYNRQLDLEQLAMAVALSPRFKDLSPAEHRHVALVGFLSGLNPEFHLHAWKNKGKLTITPDYKALINLTSDPISLKERRLTIDEMKARGIPEQDINEGAIAYVVEGWNIKHMLAFRQAGAEYEPRKGYGWWAAMKDEVEWVQNKPKNTGRRIPNDVPNGRDGEWVARKRATRDLYNQMADLRIKTPDVPGATVEEDEWTFEPNQGSVVEGAFTLVETADWLKDSAKVDRAHAYMAEQGVTASELNTALDMTDWTKSALTADEFKVVVDQIVVKKQMAGFMVPDQPKPQPEAPVTRAERSQEDKPEDRDAERETPPAALEIQPALVDVAPGKSASEGPCIDCGDNTNRKDFMGRFQCEDCAEQAADAAAAALRPTGS